MPFDATSQRRLTSPLTPVPGTPTPVELEDASSASSSSTSPSSSSGSSHQSQDSETARSHQEESSNLYWIDRIVARSIDTYPPYAPLAEQEHNYLVRWWGEEAGSDTWEARSVLLLKARETVEAFDAQEHPFTILDSRPHANEHEHEQGEHQPEYLIRYGWSSRNKGHSPHAETVWHTPSQVEKKMGVSRVTFENAVEAWENGLTPGQGASAASASAGKRDERKKKVPHPTTRQGKPGYKLIKFLEEESYGHTFSHGRALSRQKIKWRVLVEYKIRRGKVRHEWFAKSYLSTLFGTEQVKAAREAMQAESEAEENAKATEAESGLNAVDEYELERMKNIDENKELLKSLGLAP